MNSPPLSLLRCLGSPYFSNKSASVSHHLAIQTVLDPNLMTLPRVLVQHHQHLQHSIALGPVVHEIVRPYVSSVFGYGRQLLVPYSPLLRPPPRQAESLGFPDPPHPLVVDLLFTVQYRRDPPVSVPLVLPRQLHYLGFEFQGVLVAAALVPIRRTAQSHSSTRCSLRASSCHQLACQLPPLFHRSPLFSSASRRASFASA